MFSNLRATQLITFALALAERGYKGLPKMVEELPVEGIKWRKQTSRQYPHGNERERMRRARQIACGSLRTDNGLVHRGQLISKPNGSLKLRWQ